ncbi:hypothetical protein D3C81_1468560 [compost metagenome]
MQQLMLDCRIEAVQIPEDITLLHSLPMQIKQTPLLKAELWQPRGVLSGKKEPLGNGCGQFAVHRVVRPVEARPGDAVLLPIIPDGCQRIAVPDLRTEGVRPKGFDEVQALLHRVDGFPWKANDERGVSRNAHRAECTDGLFIVLAT